MREPTGIDPFARIGNFVKRRPLRAATIALVLAFAAVTVGMTEQSSDLPDRTEHQGEQLKDKTEVAAKALAARIVEAQQSPGQDDHIYTRDITPDPEIDVDATYEPRVWQSLQRDVDSLIAADYGQYTISVEAGLNDDGTIDPDKVESIFIAMDPRQHGEQTSRSGGGLYSFIITRVEGHSDEWHVVTGESTKGGEWQANYFITEHTTGDTQPDNVYPLTEGQLAESVGKAEVILNWFEQRAPINNPLYVGSA